MSRYQTYRLIGRILSLQQIPSNRDKVISGLKDINWQEFVFIADQQRVLQTLYPLIEINDLKDFFPDEVLKHLNYIFELNSSRNAGVMLQMDEINRILKQGNIKPVFLKGVGNILDNLYRFPGERILHDIDILVDDAYFEHAAAILLENGYKSDYKFEEFKKQELKHYPILFKPGEPVYLELHRRAVGNSYTRFFSSDEIFKSAVEASGDHSFLVMSDQHKIIHNFIHAQLDHSASIYARDFMRNLYDLFLLSKREDAEQVLSDFGHFRRTSSGYLDVCYKTFDYSPEKRNTPSLFLHTYRFRFFNNIRFRWMGISSLFLIRFFRGFIIKPFSAIFNKELRKELVGKLKNPAWYKKQKETYRKIFEIRKKKN